MCKLGDNGVPWRGQCRKDDLAPQVRRVGPAAFPPQRWQLHPRAGPSGSEVVVQPPGVHITKNHCPGQWVTLHPTGMLRPDSQILMVNTGGEKRVSPAQASSFKVILEYFIGFLFLAWIKRLMWSHSVCVCASLSALAVTTFELMDQFQPDLIEE